MVNYDNYNHFWLERLSHDAIQNGKNHFTKEEIQWALKQADYEYFGDYAMDDNQRIAVSIMVQVCEDELSRLVRMSNLQDEDSIKDNYVCETV